MVATIAMEGQHHVGSLASEGVAACMDIGLDGGLADHVAGLLCRPDAERP